MPLPAKRTSSSQPSTTLTPQSSIPSQTDAIPNLNLIRKLLPKKGENSKSKDTPKE